MIHLFMSTTSYADSGISSPPHAVPHNSRTPHRFRREVSHSLCRLQDVSRTPPPSPGQHPLWHRGIFLSFPSLSLMTHLLQTSPAAGISYKRAVPYFSLTILKYRSSILPSDSHQHRMTIRIIKRIADNLGLRPRMIHQNILSILTRGKGIVSRSVNTELLA